MKRHAAVSVGLAMLLALSGCVWHGAPPETKPLDFEGFWKNFRAAAVTKDRPLLRSMMTAKFDYTFGDGQPTPENAFAFWDRAEIRGWEALAEVAGTNAIEYTPPPQWELKGKVRLAPPQAATPGYRQWRAVFEQRPNGEWRFAAFLQGD